MDTVTTSCAGISIEDLTAPIPEPYTAEQEAALWEALASVPAL